MNREKQYSLEELYERISGFRRFRITGELGGLVVCIEYRAVSMLRFSKKSTYLVFSKKKIERTEQYRNDSICALEEMEGLTVEDSGESLVIQQQLPHGKYRISCENRGN